MKALKLILSQRLSNDSWTPRRSLDNGWQFWCWPVLAGFTARAIWMLSVHPEPLADYAFYFTRAIELSQGLGYQFQGHRTAFFPVGTSLLLAAPFTLIEPSLAAAKVMSLLAWSMAVLLTFLIAERVASRIVAAVAAWIVATHPDYIAFSALVASENFFIPLLLGSIWFIFRHSDPSSTKSWEILLAGVLFGLALLVRSTAIILIPLLVLVFVLRFKGAPVSAARHFVCFFACIGMVLGPWIYRNADVFGKPVLTTNGGIALWWGNNPHASGGFPLSAGYPNQDLSSPNAELLNNERFSAAAFSFMRHRTDEWIALTPAKFDFLFQAQSSDIGYALRHRYIGGPFAIEFHPRLGSAAGADLAQIVQRELTWLESKMIGGYYRIAGATIGPILQRGGWALAAIGWVLMWYIRPKDRLLLTVVCGFPICWILFHITLGNGQSRYLLSVAPFMAIGLGMLAQAILAVARFKMPKHPQKGL